MIIYIQLVGTFYREILGERFDRNSTLGPCLLLLIFALIIVDLTGCAMEGLGQDCSPEVVMSLRFPLDDGGEMVCRDSLTPTNIKENRRKEKGLHALECPNPTLHLTLGTVVYKLVVTLLEVLGNGNALGFFRL